MKRITARHAEGWVNLPELRRFQVGPLLSADDGRWITLDHLGPKALFFEHQGCLFIAHPAPCDGIWFVHHAIPKELWGRSAFTAARDSLAIFATQVGFSTPLKRLVGWTMKSNRLACNFARRLGFEIDGQMPYDDDVVIQYGASPWVVAAAAAR